MIDHVRRVIDHRQIHPPHPVTVMLQQQFGDSHGHGGLADAARPDQGHETPYRELPHQAADHRIATGDRCQARRQIVLWFLQVFEGDGRGRRDLAHRCDEAVTTLGNVDDVTVTVLPVTKGPAQCGDVHAQVDFLNHRPWPDLSDQFVFADHRAGVLDQHLQNIQGPSAQAQRLIAFHDQALIQMEREGAEVQHRVAVDISEAIHASSPAGTCPARESIQAPYLPCNEFRGILAGLGDGTTATGGASRSLRCARRTRAS